MPDREPVHSLYDPQNNFTVLRCDLPDLKADMIYIGMDIIHLAPLCPGEENDKWTVSQLGGQFEAQVMIFLKEKRDGCFQL